MKLILSKNNWSNRDNLWVTGFIFSGNRFLRDEELLDYFSGIESAGEFLNRLRSSNGQVSVIIEYGKETWAAVDRTRNKPVFYTMTDGEFILSDDCYKLAELRTDNQFDPVSYNCFLASGYTINDRTLLREIYQVEAGAMVIFEKKANSVSYHKPASDKSRLMDLDSAAGELTVMLDNVFREYFTALCDRFIAIPLSGGYDSRLVALMASKYHPDKVLCYTYGRADNHEATLAMETARRLNIKWIRIEYNSDLVTDFIHDGYFENYYPWVSDLNGMFFLQEYFAVKYLKDNKLIPANTVFISGYSGDFIAGSYLTPGMKKELSGIQISDLILREYFRLVKLKCSDQEEIRSLILERIPVERSSAWKIIETWDMKERHAKFIVNAARVFNFFGYEYIFPLWDNRLVDFLLPLPFELRMDRRVWEHSLREIIFRENNLILDQETNPNPWKKKIQRFKEKAKPLLPAKLRNRFISSYNAIYYDGMTKLLLNDISGTKIIQPRQPNYYNSYIIQWYLKKTAERFGIKAIL